MTTRFVENIGTDGAGVLRMTGLGHKLTVVHDDLIYHTSGTQTLVTRISTEKKIKIITKLFLSLLPGARSLGWCERSTVVI